MNTFREQMAGVEFHIATASSEPMHGALQLQHSAIKEREYLPDLGNLGSQPIDKIPPLPDAALTNGDRLSQTRWVSRIPGDSRWQEEEDDEGSDTTMSSEDEEQAAATKQDRYMVTVENKQYLLHDYLGDERDALIVRRMHRPIL